MISVYLLLDIGSDAMDVNIVTAGCQMLVSE